MQLNNSTSLREMLEQMSTEQLDELLNQELDREPVDENAVRMIMNILREREKDIPSQITPEIRKAWEKCQNDLEKIEKNSFTSYRVSKIFLRFASVAAVFVLLIAVVPRQAEADSPFDRLARWTADILEFFSPADDSARLTNYAFKTDHPGLQQVYDTLIDLGVTEPVVPMWLPDGYTLMECLTNETDAKTCVYSNFKGSNGDFILSVDVYDTDVSRVYYKDDVNIEKYEVDGTTFNIMRNEKVWVVVWAKNNIECTIAVDCQEDTLYEILGSIYVMEEMK